ncbi:MAG TPA: magnesium transporter [Candidatus Onthocola gallistercoris]|uniref:Magnesium transporter MgtE n=1 Tax=Candidatus Onthocola gallistercoris TaxID=2840876 RepID=A0A9D1KYJ5_9FIRM|nr:magnesium transporter [Candidatus Onthocola gallistercoris]
MRRGISMYEEIKHLIDTQQYTRVREIMNDMNPVDTAQLIETFPEAERIKVFRLLPKSLAADVFSYLTLEAEQDIITRLTEKEAGNILDSLYADDASDLLDEMPANVVKRLLAHTTPETRRDINHLLQYPDDSAGSIMTVEFVDLKEHNTVSQALHKIRLEGVDKETINTCYVLNAHRKLIGAVSLRRLLLSDPVEKIGDIMEDNVISVGTLADQEAVAHTFQKYDFTSMPVVDKENRLVGIITIDDIVDIMQQEATEDMEMMSAATPADKPYMKTGVLETWKNRIPWLLLLMISSTFTSKIISSYEAALASYVVLTTFIPMFMGTGGNAGGQASVIIIRGLSLNEITFKDTPRIIWKELRVGLLCGITLSVVNFFKLLLFDRVTIPIAFVVSLTMIMTVVMAKLIGAVLPIAAKRIGFDPAVMASPFITTIVDAMSLMIYFRVACTLLNIG